MRASFAVLIAVLATACQREDAPPPAAPPTKAIAPAPLPPPARPRIAHLSVRDQNVLCMHGAARADPIRCIALHATFAGALSAGDAPDETPIALVSHGERCTFVGDTLTCGHTTEQVELRSGQHFGYFVGDKLRWFAPPVDPCAHDGDKPMRMGELAIGARQVSVAYRIGCAVDADGAAMCWSDPAHPIKLAAPEPLAEVMAQNSFELCARGVSGALYCAPPPALPDNLACNMTDLSCGASDVEDAVLHKPFDPLAPIRKPLARVPLPFAAVSLARAEDEQYGICMDTHLHLTPTRDGGCALGPAGEVACFAPDEHAWTTYPITHLPPATAVFAGRDASFALTGDGALYRWTPEALAAIKLDLPPIAEVTPPLFAQNGPSTKARLRCALTRAGEVRCWRAEGHDISPAFDPLADHGP